MPSGLCEAQRPAESTLTPCLQLDTAPESSPWSEPTPDGGFSPFGWYFREAKDCQFPLRGCYCLLLAMGAWCVCVGGSSVIEAPSLSPSPASPELRKPGGSWKSSTSILSLSHASTLFSKRTSLILQRRPFPSRQLLVSLGPTPVLQNMPVNLTKCECDVGGLPLLHRALGSAG